MTINTAPGAVDTGTWRMTGPYDAKITEGADPALRISNAVTSGSFGDQLFSPTLDVPATETGPACNVHRILRARAGRALQPGLRVHDGLPPAAGPGRPGRPPREPGNHPDGINLVTCGGCTSTPTARSACTYTTVATGLDASKPHTVKLMLIKKPDTKKSTNNDVFSVQVDGKPVKNTTLEAYYEKTGEGEYNTDTLMFRLSGAVRPRVARLGLLIDDVTMATSSS